jgi:hypothetical protein
MTIGSLTTEPGFNVLTIDGTSWKLPKSITPEDPLRLSQSDLASGDVSVIGTWAGEGMPNVLDGFRLVMPWDIDDTNAALADAIELLRASGGAHDLCYWKQRAYVYTLALSQSVIYLPRRDAYAAGYSGFDVSVNMLTASLNGTPLDVSYQTTVELADSVPDGDIYVSETAIDHPTTGKPNVARCKLGSTVAAGDVLVVRYFPLYRVQAVDVVTLFSFAGREDKTVTLVEVKS